MKSPLHINALQILLEHRFPALAQNARSIAYLQELLALYDIAFEEGYAEGRDQGVKDAESSDQSEIESLEERAWQLQERNEELRESVKDAVYRKEIAERRYEALKKKMGTS